MMKTLVVILILGVCVTVTAMIAASYLKFMFVRNTSCANACINYLRIIDAGKEQWAMELHKTNGEEVVVSEVNQYIRGTTTPICPQGGKYTYGRVGEPPSCSGFTTDPDGTKRPHKLVIY